MDTTWYPGSSQERNSSRLNLEGVFDSSFEEPDCAPVVGNLARTELRVEIKKIYGRDYPESSGERPLDREVSGGEAW